MSKVWSVLFHNTRLLRRKTSYTPESSIIYFSLQHWRTDYRFFEQTLEGLKRLCITLTADGKSVTKIKLLVVCFQPFSYLKMKTSAFTVNEILFLQYFQKSWPTADYKKRSETRVHFFSICCCCRRQDQTLLCSPNNWVLKRKHQLIYCEAIAKCLTSNVHKGAFRYPSVITFRISSGFLGSITLKVNLLGTNIDPYASRSVAKATAHATRLFIRELKQ